MKSEWRVTSNSINGKTVFAAFRLIDKAAVDHSGNREYNGGYHENKDYVEKIVEALNTFQLDNN